MERVSERLAIADLTVEIARPRDSEALLDEDAFAVEEYLPYWAELWPSALALAHAVGAADLPARVLELGCGLGLPAIVAALRGACVVATDWSADAVEAAAANARRNGVQLQARLWRWDAPAAELGEPWPLVIAADVLYEQRNGPLLLTALAQLVAGEAWIADPGRRYAAGFLEQAGGAGWEVGRVEHAGLGTVTVHRLRRATSAA